MYQTALALLECRRLQCNVISCDPANWQLLPKLAGRQLPGSRAREPAGPRAARIAQASWFSAGHRRAATCLPAPRGWGFPRSSRPRSGAGWGPARPSRDSPGGCGLQNWGDPAAWQQPPPPDVGPGVPPGHIRGYPGAPSRGVSSGGGRGRPRKA